jgi:excinuclease ABC subunit C
VSPVREERLAQLPDRPGCYLFRGPDGEILYVGKARSLRHRVRSYFQESRQLDPKTERLLAHVADLEWIVTETEVDALVLEQNLIKEHQPRFNIRLRDDKQYPYLRLGVQEPWPRLEVVRRPAADGARYFGPYPHARAVWDTLHTLRRVFPYRSCSDRRLAQPHPCLYVHIRRCLGPCVGAVTPEAYQAMVGELAQFLEGRGEAVVARLEADMRAAAEAWRFEEAAELRDRIRALQAVLERQRVQLAQRSDQDALAVARGAEGDLAAVEVFFVREGKVVGREGFILQGVEGVGDGEVLAAFLAQHYGGGAPVPAEVLLSAPLPDEAEARRLLEARRGGPVRLRVPRRGPLRQLLALVAENAAEHLAAERWRRERARDASEGALEDLAARLGLPAPPRRIECYDNSNLQGAHPVSAMVVFEDGRPKKSEYRRFRVRGVVGPDDFATMREVLRRRFRRLQAERAALAAASQGEVPERASGFARWPDLVLIDGGRGQLSAALEAMRELGVEGVPAFALAKEHEWLYAEDRPEPIVLPEGSAALRLLQQLRDEAHRFGLRYHRALRGRAALASVLEEVPGIGPKRRKALLTAFGSLEALREASVDELARVPGMTRAAAEELHAFLRSDEGSFSSLRALDSE